MLRIVINALPRNDRFARLAAAIGITVKFRKIRGRDVNAHPMPRLETIRGRPQVDLKAVNVPRLSIAVPCTQNAMLQLNGTPIREHIGQSRGKIGVERTRTRLEDHPTRGDRP